MEGLEEISGERVAWVKWSREKEEDIYLGTVWPSWAWNGKAGKQEGVEWWENLGRQVNQLKERGRVVVVGDWNARIGLKAGPSGDERGTTNSNGVSFLKFLEEEEMVAANAQAQCEGKWTFMEGGSKSVIDFIVVQDENRDQVVRVKVEEERRFGGGGRGSRGESDHNAVWVEMSGRVDQTTGVREPRKKWKTNEL